MTYHVIDGPFAAYEVQPSITIGRDVIPADSDFYEIEFYRILRLDKRTGVESVFKDFPTFEECQEAIKERIKIDQMEDLLFGDPNENEETEDG